MNLYGPLPLRLAQQLEEKLQSHQVHAKLLYSKEELDTYHANRTSRIPSQHPVWHGDESVVYIEIDDKDLDLVRGDLEKMGIVLNFEEPELDAKDYLCPVCEESSQTPRRCTKHNVDYVDYDKWLLQKKAKSERGMRLFSIVALVILGLISAVYLYDTFIDNKGYEVIFRH